MRELLDTLERLQPDLAKRDAELHGRIEMLTTRAHEDSARMEQQTFRHHVAYALQDLEKLPGLKVETIAAELRSEMTRLAGSAPGLENERMLALMRNTATIDDKSVVSAIRQSGAQIGTSLDQNGPAIEDVVRRLEARVQAMPTPAPVPLEDGDRATLGATDRSVSSPTATVAAAVTAPEDGNVAASKPVAVPTASGPQAQSQTTATGEAAQTPANGHAPPEAAAARDAGAQASGPQPAADRNEAKTDLPTAANTSVQQDPINDLIKRMDALSQSVRPYDNGLAERLQGLAQSDMSRPSEDGHRQKVAYALQDLEKSPIGPIAIPSQLREEMTQRAASFPGLENERMLALMRNTAAIADPRLVDEIRTTASRLSQRTDQTDSRITSAIEVLENRVRIAPRASEPDTVAPAAANRSAEPPLAPTQTATNGNGARAPADRPDRAPVAPDNVTGNRINQPATNEAPFAPIGNQGQGQPVNSVLNTLMRGLRGTGQAAGAPWAPPDTPMAERLSTFERKMTESADEQSFERAMKTGRAALDAISAFNNGQGAAIMARINEAAHTEPGGLPAVLAEMRQGGRFADLRQQFSAALQSDRGLAAAYETAASSLERYGRNRSAVQDIIGRRTDATAVTSRFEQLDADIGKAAAATPSHNDGRSMIEDLTKKAAEILQRAVAAVASLVSRSQSAEATSSPSPSPSMG